MDQVDCAFDVVVLFFLNLLEVDQVFLVGLIDLVDLVALDVLVELVLFFVVSFGSSDVADDSDGVIELIFFFELVEVVICFELMFLSGTDVLDDLVTVIGVGWLVVEINGKRSLGLDKLVILTAI